MTWYLFLWFKIKKKVGVWWYYNLHTCIWLNRWFISCLTDVIDGEILAILIILHQSINILIFKPIQPCLSLSHFSINTTMLTARYKKTTCVIYTCFSVIFWGFPPGFSSRVGVLLLVVKALVKSNKTGRRMQNDT